MAKWGKVDCSQLKAMQEAVSKLSEQEMNAFCISCCKALAGRLLALVIPKTPTGVYPKGSGKMGGTLKRGWGNKSGAYANSLSVTKTGNTYMVEIINPIEYASYVEYGHRTVNGGWVPGRYMLTISEQRLEQLTPALLEKLLQAKLREVFNVGN